VWVQDGIALRDARGKVVMHDIARHYSTESQSLSLRRSGDTINSPTLCDDRAPALGDFFRTCDSMMNGFESLYDGIDMSCDDAERKMPHAVGNTSMSDMGMPDDSSVIQ
jgi:hypothetical protein